MSQESHIAGLVGFAKRLQVGGSGWLESFFFTLLSPRVLNFGAKQRSYGVGGGREMIVG